jgi:hypothetical protein
MNHVRSCLIALVSTCIGLLPLSAQHELLGFRDFRPQQGLWQEAGDASVNPEQRKRLNLAPGTGLIANGPGGETANLLTTAEFGDVEVHVEYLIPEESNSGVYLMGRYEVQIRDSFGVTPPRYSDAGGIYQRWDPNRTPRGWEGVPPRVNAARPAGEWQTLDIVFHAPRFDATGRKTENARFVRVVHNGKVVHEDVQVTGPTQSATYEDERAVGPIMFQGDHGPVAFRNLKVRRLHQQPERGAGGSSNPPP